MPLSTRQTNETQDKVAGLCEHHSLTIRSPTSAQGRSAPSPTSAHPYKCSEGSRGTDGSDSPAPADQTPVAPFVAQLTKPVSAAPPRAAHSAAVRLLPSHPLPLDPARVAALYAAELEKYQATSGASKAEIEAAKAHIPLGVTSSFQVHDPYPLAIASARGSKLRDVDGRELLDFSMGFGSMLVGHLHPYFVAEMQKVLATGTLLVMATPASREAAERLCARFNIDQLRFCNSGTEATMYAVRVARAHTGRMAVVKIEGGYHGSYDALAVSAKPPLAAAGPADAPVAVPTPWTNPGTVHVVPYNNLGSLARVLEAHAGEVACVVVEPVMQNLAIVLPDPGYLEGVRALCDRHGVLLVFDEVKTGLTAGPHGAAVRLGVKPDLITLAKSIGGGAPLAAFGGRREVMATIATGSAAHYGTFNGNPLALAAWKAVDRACTPEALAAAEAMNVAALRRIHAAIERHRLPAHVVGFGVKGCVTWAAEPVRNYRDWKATDFQAAELAFLWWLNRRVVTPPGLDDQWLVSLQHTQSDVDELVEAFESLAAALRG